MHNDMKRIGKIIQNARQSNGMTQEALALAGLCAEGETLIENAQFIERGYEDFSAQLNSLGADTLWVE